MIVTSDPTLEVPLPEYGQPLAVDVRIVPADHRVLTERNAQIGPHVGPATAPAASIELSITETLRQHVRDGEPVYLEFQSVEGTARLEKPLALALGQDQPRARTDDRLRSGA